MKILSFNLNFLQIQRILSQWSPQTALTDGVTIPNVKYVNINIYTLDLTDLSLTQTVESQCYPSDLADSTVIEINTGMMEVRILII